MPIAKGFAKNVNAHKILFDPDDSRPDYIGINQSYLADSSTSDWEIYAFTYTTATSSNVTEIRKRSGVYSDRSTLLP